MTFTVRRALAAFAGLVCIMSFPIGAHASFLVVPGAQATAEGNSGFRYPFGYGSTLNQRYLQVYAASEFAALTGPGWITQIAFRPDAVSGSAFSTTLPDIQINLSTTQVNPDAAELVFANYVGADDTVVVGRGPLALSSSDTGPAGGPKDFDIVITFTTPFLYNPTDGNLLLDVRNYRGGTTTYFDMQNTLGDGVSQFGGSVNLDSNTPEALTTYGLVTRFTFAPVPEFTTCPAGALMLIPFGLSTVRMLRKRRCV